MYRGCAEAQAVSRRLLTAAVRVRAQVSEVEFVVDEVALGQIFFESFGFPLSVSFHRCSVFIYVLSGGRTMGPSAVAVPLRRSLTSPQE
jgi:hypothetical protein